MLARFHFEAIETTLRDGTPVLLRPVRPEDRELLRRGFERLSEHSRLQRFLTPVSCLSERQLRYLTELDFVDHVAWGAVRAHRPDEGIGVARWVRVNGEPNVAEAAITVADGYQGKGLGTLLLALLALAARAGGITALRGYVLMENAQVRALLEQFGATTRIDAPGVLRVDVPVQAESLPDSAAARVLKALAPLDPAASRQASPAPGRR